MTIFNKIILVSIALAALPVAAQNTLVLPPNKPDTTKPVVTIAPETVLASNATVKVTKADFDAEMSRIPESEHFEFLTSRTRIASLLENILINKVLAKEATEQKLDQNQKVKDEIINHTEKILAKYRGQQLLREIKVKDFTAAAREAYIVAPQKSLRPARYKLWQTLVTFVGRDKETARKRAAEVRDRLERGDNLAEIAKEFSDDAGSRRSDGIIDFTELKDFEMPFADALKKMKPGDIGNVVETRYGFHVVYLMELMPEKKLSFEEMKPELLEEARLAFLKSSYEHHLDAIRLDPSLKIDADSLDNIRPRIPENVKPVYTPPETIKAPPRKVIKP